MTATSSLPPEAGELDSLISFALQPTATDTGHFLATIAQFLMRLSQADSVTIWDNNVFGDQLVQLYPPCSSEDSRPSIPRVTSLTGLAVERADVVLHDDIWDSSGVRQLVKHPSRPDAGITHMLSIPVLDACDSQLVHLVVNLRFSKRAAFDNARHSISYFRAIPRVLGAALDYHLYRMDEIVRHSIHFDAAAPTISGMSPLFASVFPELQRLTRCTKAFLYRYEAATGALVIERVCPEADTTSSREFPDDLVAQCVAKHRPIVALGHPGPDSSHRGVARVAAPLTSHAGEVIGVLACERESLHGDTFTSLDIYLIEAYSRALAPTMERFRRIREATALPRAISEMLRAAGKSGSLDMVLAETLASVVEIFNVATGSIYLLEPSEAGPRLRIRAAAGIDVPLLKLSASYAVGEGITGALADGDGQLLRFSTDAERVANPSIKAKYDHQRLPYSPVEQGASPAFLGVPIKAMDGRVLGVWKIQYVRPGRAHPDPNFTDEDVQLAWVISSFLAYAVEYHQQRDTSEERLKVLAECSLAVGAATNESDVATHVFAALASCGWEHAAVSLCDEAQRSLTGFDGSTAEWRDAIVRSEAIPVQDSDDPRAMALRERRPHWAVRATTGPTLGSRSSRQHVLPLLLSDERLGTLQVDAQGHELDNSGRLLLGALAGHLAVGISRIRSLRKQQEEEKLAIAQARVMAVVGLTASVVHTTKHLLGRILVEMDKVLKSDSRDAGRVQASIRSWRTEIEEARRDLEGGLRRGRDDIPRQPVVVDVHQVIQEVIASLKATAQCKFRNHWGAQNSHCEIPPLALREILSVLFVNSIQAHARNVIVTTQNRTMKGTRSVSYLCLDVADDGSGLSTEDSETIFQPGFSTKPQAFAGGLGGSGLGLFVARHLAGEYEGRLWVIDSEKGRRGVTFRLELPTAVRLDGENRV